MPLPDILTTIIVFCGVAAVLIWLLKSEAILLSGNFVVVIVALYSGISGLVVAAMTGSALSASIPLILYNEKIFYSGWKYIANEHHYQKLEYSWRISPKLVMLFSFLATSLFAFLLSQFIEIHFVHSGTFMLNRFLVALIIFAFFIFSCFIQIPFMVKSTK